MLFRMTSPWPLPLSSLTPRLEVVSVDDQRSVFLNGHLVARYRCDDKGTERVLVTQLAEVVPWPDRQIAAAFDLHPVTLSRFRRQARQGGAVALLPRKSGPQGPRKRTPQREARCRALRAQGLSLRAIAERVSRGGRTISHVRVAALFRDQPAPPPQPALPLETVTPPPPEDTPTRSAVGESCFSRYAGALLLHAALARLDVWGRFPTPGRGHRPRPAVRMAADGGRPRFLLRLALPLSRGREERPPPGSGRAHRPTPRSLGFEFAEQGQGPGGECRSPVLLAGDVPPLPRPGAGLGRTVLRGRPFLSLLRPASHAAGLGCQAPPGREGTHRGLSPRRPGTGVVLLLPTPQRLAGPRPAHRGGRDPPAARLATLHPGLRSRRLQPRGLPPPAATEHRFHHLSPGPQRPPPLGAEKVPAGLVLFRGPPPHLSALREKDPPAAGRFPAHHSVPRRRRPADPRAHQPGPHLSRRPGRLLPALALAAGEPLQVPRPALRH